MNSPDERFQRRIDDAARSLRRRAPPASDALLDAIRARGRDLDAAIDTAARALASDAPLDAFDVRIAAVARELRKPAPAFERPRLRLLRPTRTLVALAASLLLGVTLFFRLAREAAAAPGSALLDAAALEQSLVDEARLDREADRIAARMGGDAALAQNEVARSLLEEVAFLDQALAECRAALAISRAHGHLREQLIELTGQRVDLLRRIEAAR